MVELEEEEEVGCYTAKKEEGWLLYGQKGGGAHVSPLYDAMFMTIWQSYS
jgi:hypothetical protein